MTFLVLISTFREQLNQKASEDEKARLVRFTEEKNNQILHYNNKLAKLQTRLDQVSLFYVFQ